MMIKYAGDSPCAAWCAWVLLLVLLVLLVSDVKCLVQGCRVWGIGPPLKVARRARLPGRGRPSYTLLTDTRQSPFIRRYSINRLFSLLLTWRGLENINIVRKTARSFLQTLRPPRHHLWNEAIRTQFLHKVPRVTFSLPLSYQSSCQVACDVPQSQSAARNLADVISHRKSAVLHMSGLQLPPRPPKGTRLQWVSTSFLPYACLILAATILVVHGFFFFFVFFSIFIAVFIFSFNTIISSIVISPTFLYTFFPFQYQLHRHQYSYTVSAFDFLTTITFAEQWPVFNLSNPINHLILPSS